jgi:hypothetical protein
MNLLLLALGTIVRASARHYDFLDGSLAHEARLSSAAVGAVLELEEAFFAFGIHVVGDGRASGSDGFLQHFLKSGMEFG